MSNEISASLPISDWQRDDPAWARLVAFDKESYLTAAKAGKELEEVASGIKDSIIDPWSYRDIEV